MNTTIQGQVRACAEAVLFNQKKRDDRFMRYNMVYFGEAMRRHQGVIRDEGLAPVRPDTQRLVDRAEAALKADCEGQDCSYPQQVAV